MTEGLPIDALLGFRRRILIVPRRGICTVELEDDYHRMTVEILHDDEHVTDMSCAMIRVPWTICPGARTQLMRSFAGQRLSHFPRLADKTENCTHLFDMALLAGAHALDHHSSTIDILVSDPIDGVRLAELRRDGCVALAWSLGDGRFLSPDAIAGLSLYALRDWIAGLGSDAQEAARLLRWASMIAHGRTIARSVQDDASRLQSGSCFTFQEVRKADAVRLTGSIRDFVPGSPEPLGDLCG